MSINALGEATRQGKELECGRVAVTASVAITTPFRYIDGVSVTQEIGTAPGDLGSNFSFAVSNNVVTIYAWKTTSGSDPTLVANDAEVDVSYIIVGRRDR